MNRLMYSRTGSFDEHQFWSKLRRYAVLCGRELVEKALWLYFASRRPDIPSWARATVYGALAYFVLPTDLLPDMVPITGYSDDLAVLTMAVVTITTYIDSGVKAQANQTIQRWFGD